RINGEVASLDTANKTLRLADGQSLTYDAALLATGGTPNPLTLPGADLPQVFLLRSKDQATRILNAAKPGQRVVIIGDSFIALESASA
ncbi:pyridine nucleotide-disulfide oxidoreductase, partial [Pseudomonas sp. GW247-3R2A]